jgi:uncharacterized protein
MRFNVAQLLQEGVGARRNYSLDVTFEPLPETGTTRANGEITLTHMDNAVWASGPIETNAFGTCARCLNISEYSLHFRLNEEYIPTMDIYSGAPVSDNVIDETGEGTFALEVDHTLDLTEAVRQYAIVNLPMNPLCNSNCAGLCSTCGTNLNDSHCDCTTHTDSRWSPLLDFLVTNTKE